MLLFLWLLLLCALAVAVALSAMTLSTCVHEGVWANGSSTTTGPPSAGWPSVAPARSRRGVRSADAAAASPAAGPSAQSLQSASGQAPGAPQSSSNASNATAAVEAQTAAAANTSTRAPAVTQPLRSDASNNAGGAIGPTPAPSLALSGAEPSQYAFNLQRFGTSLTSTPAWPAYGARCNVV